MSEFRELRPFKLWCQKVLPLVYDDSLSYYELLCKVVDYLNNTINDVNCLNTVFVKLNDYVKNYFNNLDVQKEIDNKLDEMANDGSLLTLFKTFIGYVMPEWFGCVGNGVTDDTVNMKKAIQYCTVNNVLLFSNSSSVYLITSMLEIRGISLDFNNATLIINGNLENGVVVNSESYNNFSKHRKFIKNLIIIANDCANAIKFECAKYTIENLSVTTKNTGVNVTNGYENTFKNCNITGVENTIGFDIHGDDALFIDCITIDCKIGAALRGVNRFHNFHSWIYNDAIRYGSKTFDVKSGYNFLEQCYCDSTQYGVYWSSYGHVYSSQMYFLNAVTYYNDNHVTPYCMYDSGYPSTPFSNNPLFLETFINVLEGYKISNFNYIFEKENKYVLNGVEQNIHYILHNPSMYSNYFTVIKNDIIEYKDYYYVSIEVQAIQELTSSGVQLFENTPLKNNMQFNGLVQVQRFGASSGNCTFYSSEGNIYAFIPNLNKNNVISFNANIPKEYAENNLKNFVN